MISIASILALTLLLSAPPAQTPSPKAVTPAEADNHLVERIAPTVPPLAKMARVGGKVDLRIVISPSGVVSEVKVINGHPLLVQSAIEAVRKWKYKPFIEDGKPIAVVTDVELEFPGGMTEPEKAVRKRFFSVEEECRALLNEGKYADAEGHCRHAVSVSNELPKNVVLERSEARALLGNSIYLQRRFQEAIPLYEEALALDKRHRKPDDADLATAYANLGRAYAGAGELAKADELYASAVSTFEAAIQSLPQMKQNYTERLKRTLNEFAQVKDAEGQADAARQLRSKAAAL
jgi:TonB family protein